MSEDDPVRDDEVLLRRVHKTWIGGPFVPNKRDTDGLSIFRQEFVTAEQLCALKGEQAAEYFVLAVVARDARALGVTLRPQRDDDLPGHTLIVEITFAAYKDKTQTRSKELTRLLAELGGRNVVVRATR